MTEVNDEPIADAGGPYSGTVGVEIAFDASASQDYDNQDPPGANDQTLSYSWDFGDESTGAGETTSHAYDAAGTYTVTLTVSDGTASDTSTTTVEVTAQPTTTGIHVGEIVMDGDVSIRGRNTFCLATATILILDESGNPVEGATVHGSWSDAYSETVSAATSTEGTVTFQTNWVKGGGTFTFTVENLVKEGCDYDSGSNTKTGDTISVP